MCMTRLPGDFLTLPNEKIRDVLDIHNGGSRCTENQGKYSLYNQETGSAPRDSLDGRGDYTNIEGQRTLICSPLRRLLWSEVASGRFPPGSRPFAPGHYPRRGSPTRGTYSGPLATGHYPRRGSPTRCIESFSLRHERWGRRIYRPGLLDIVGPSHADTILGAGARPGVKDWLIRRTSHEDGVHTGPIFWDSGPVAPGHCPQRESPSRCKEAIYV